ncbi:MAG TPA: hypothetical protein VFK88_10205 [Gallionella sp.]|nr:hypothetical protein [Gallionella sp.]
MKHCLLLYLCAEHLHAQLVAGEKITAQLKFTDSPEGRDDFATFLQTARRPAYLLVDLIEEDFRHETVPHLSGARRSAQLQRKFEQFYRDTPFRQGVLLQRQPTGRHDDVMRFSALTNPALLAPWLDIMLDRKIPLAGIYSVPQISGTFIGHHPANHVLLISWERSAGLRQSYFNEQQLQLSRLTPLHADLTFRAAVTNELVHTCQYLKSLSLLPPEQTLDVRILCHADDHAALAAGGLPDEADVRYDFVDLNEIAEQFKFNYSFTDSDATPLFLYQLTRRLPGASYASAAHRHYHRLWQLRRTLYHGSSALLLASLAWAAVNLAQGSAHKTEALALNDRTQRLLTELQTMTPRSANTQASAADMKTAVTLMREFALTAVAPVEILHPLSMTLDDYPEIELDELAWRTEAAEASPTHASGNWPVAIITIKGHFAGDANDYRAALDHLERFRHDLTARGYHVIVQEQPLDLSPTGSITDPTERHSTIFDFSLKLSRPLTNKEPRA